MEPRSIERGKYSIACGRVSGSLLQWSRDQLNAERSRGLDNAPANGLLQWSRDQLNAERGYKIAEREIERRFNGAAIN